MNMGQALGIMGDKKKKALVGFVTGQSSGWVGWPLKIPLSLSLSLFVFHYSTIAVNIINL